MANVQYVVKNTYHHYFLHINHFAHCPLFWVFKQNK